MLHNSVFDGTIAAVLEDVRQSSDLEGLAVFDLNQHEPDRMVSHTAGAGGPDTVAAGHGMLAGNPGGPAHGIASDKRPIVVCPWLLPPSRPGGMMLWRAPRGRPWVEADHGLVAALAVLLRASIGAGAAQVGLDRLTGLPNRRWFVDEADRHIKRLNLDGRAGTLFLVDVDDLRRLNAAFGRNVGDGVLVRLAGRLRAMIRPGDLLARVGGDEFALWQNGMDHMTAAERADALCNAPLFDDLPGDCAPTLSIGIAGREAGGKEDVRALLRRAHMAAREVKGRGGGAWQVSRAGISRPSSPP